MLSKMRGMRRPRQTDSGCGQRSEGKATDRIMFLEYLSGIG